MLGIGYSFPSMNPDARFFLDQTVARMREANLSAYWALDPELLSSTSPAWAQLARGQDSGTPSGVLVGYADVFGHPAFRAAGVPALPASGAYEDTPDVIAGRVRAVLALSEE